MKSSKKAFVIFYRLILCLTSVLYISIAFLQIFTALNFNFTENIKFTMLYTGAFYWCITIILIWANIFKKDSPDKFIICGINLFLSYFGIISILGVFLEKFEVVATWVNVLITIAFALIAIKEFPRLWRMQQTII